MRTYLKSLTTIVGVILLIVSSSLALGEESRGLYLVGNLSLFSEDVEVRHGDGFGFGAGVGYQFNNLFSLELSWDSAPAVESSKLNEYLESLPRVSGTRHYFDVDPEANRFVSLVGVASFSTSERVSLVVRAGLARYWRLESVHFYLRPSDGSGSQNGDVIRTEIDEQEYTPMMSAGVRFKLPRFENASIEVKLARYFKADVESSFLGASIKFPFPKG